VDTAAVTAVTADAVQKQALKEAKLLRMQGSRLVRATLVGVCSSHLDAARPERSVTPGPRRHGGQEARSASAFR